MKRHTIGMIATVALVMFAALGASAQERIGKGKVELGIDVGGSKFDNAFDDDTNLRAAARLGVFLSDNFELGLELARTDINIPSADLTTGTLNATWNFQTGSRFVPYVEAGAGSSNYHINELFGGGSDDDTGLALKGAVGTRIFFGESDRVALRLEAAWQRVDVVGDDEAALNLSGGLVVRLGK